eukprot:8665-Heterococcus_DN1.PRE.2
MRSSNAAMFSRRSLYMHSVARSETLLHHCTVRFCSSHAMQHAAVYTVTQRLCTAFSTAFSTACLCVVACATQACYSANRGAIDKSVNRRQAIQSNLQVETKLLAAHVPHALACFVLMPDQAQHLTPRCQ